MPRFLRITSLMLYVAAVIFGFVMPLFLVLNGKILYSDLPKYTYFLIALAGLGFVSLMIVNKTERRNN